MKNLVQRAFSKCVQVDRASRSEASFFLAALKACSSNDLERVRQIHAVAAGSGDDINMFVGSRLVSMYAKCGCMVEARGVFDKLESRDSVAWTALIWGYAENGEGEIALELFKEMRDAGHAPDARTFVSALKACTALAEREDGEQVDGRLVKWEPFVKGVVVQTQAAHFGCEADLFVSNTLIDFYSKCGAIAEARKLFDRMRQQDVVSWTALVLGYAENGEGWRSLHTFGLMQLEGCKPNAFTYVAACKGCAVLALKEEGIPMDGRAVKVKSLARGRNLHLHALEGGFGSHILLANTLIDMYGKCGCMVLSQNVFDSLRRPDVVSWTSLILGFAENGGGYVALELYSRFRSQGCIPDSLMFVAALKACGAAAALEEGRTIHSEIVLRGLASEQAVVNTLVDFYSKCGNMVDARQVFDSLHSSTRSIVTWNALIAGYGRHGETCQVFQLFQRLRDEGLKPDSVTFLCLLAACSHAGLVDKANEFFASMSAMHKVEPTIEHYCCMVDVLGRANRLEDALAMVRTMPFKPTAVCWRTLLDACRKWKNAEVGRLAFESMLKLDDRDPSAYVFMANIYQSLKTGQR